MHHRDNFPVHPKKHDFIRLIWVDGKSRSLIYSILKTWDPLVQNTQWKGLFKQAPDEQNSIIWKPLIRQYNTAE